jgi:hypothetical protein
MILSICLAAVAIQAKDTPSDPAFQLAKTLVGGKWEGQVEDTAKVRFNFTLEEHGTKIVGHGLLMVPGKDPMPILTTLGWDADAKQTYYLDTHGHNTVYFGHVTRDGNDLVFDFKGLVGDSGHYLATEHVGKNEYTSNMTLEMPDGKWKDLGFHLGLHRVK